MASTIGHAAAGLAICSLLRPASPVTRRYWWLGAIGGALPDVDVIAPITGWRALEWLGGHRAFTHSFLFAGMLGIVLALVVRQSSEPTNPPPLGRLWLVFACATASHGALDSLTTYGQGITFLAPFDWTRYTAPWHPLDPDGAAAGSRGVVPRLVLGFANEAIWVWLPAAVIALSATRLRVRRPGSRVST